MRHLRRLVACSAALVLGGGAAAQSESGDAAPAHVACTSDAPCRVDLATFVGWRVFEAECATCHGADARGSTFAPDLTQRMRGMTQRNFFAALDQGYFGPQSTMPPRGRDPNVAPYYDELWSFLRARATGALPPGPVERLPDPSAREP